MIHLRPQDSASLPAEQKQTKEKSSRSVLPFLIFCHHVLQTSGDHGDGEERRKTTTTAKETEALTTASVGSSAAKISQTNLGQLKPWEEEEGRG